MDDKVVRQIRDKGNGQSIIYVTKKDLIELDCGVDDYVMLTKVKRTINIKEIVKKAIKKEVSEK